jgi:CDGSH iron-sulfur domain-containing protein 3
LEPAPLDPFFSLLHFDALSKPGSMSSFPAVHRPANFGDNPFIVRRGEFSMFEAKIAQKGPYPVELEAGKSYFWCSCGLSANQPFCDGSHKTTDHTPVKFEATESGTAYLCGCKHTANPVFCDGTHSTL